MSLGEGKSVRARRCVAGSRARRRFIVLTSLGIFVLVGTRLLAERSLLLPVETLRRRFWSGSSDYAAVVTDDDGSVPSEHLDDSHPRRDNAGAAPAYAPGIYMAGRRPANSTACRWYHGLPTILSYPASEITGTPENGDRGSYRVLPFVVRARTGILGERLELPELTLCTHSTADQVYNVVELARRWEGPISLAIFAPGLDAGLAVALLERACRCEPEMAKVSVHLIFPAGRPPALSLDAEEESRGDCAASDLQWRESDTERKIRGMTYPINVGRNVARSFAETNRVLVSDIELLPSARLASGFLEMIDDARSTPRPGLIFVVPTFEIDANQRPPSDKRQLVAAVSQGLAVYFHRFVCLHCQKFPGIARWLLRPDPGRVRPLVITRREYPHNRWEPVFIGTREDPLYNEDMSWEGRQDKMAQMLEMCLMNYRLIVLDGAFLVHAPGIKRKPTRTNTSKDARSRALGAPDRAQEKRNSRIYQVVTRRLLKRYPVNRKCGQ